MSDVIDAPFKPEDGLDPDFKALHVSEEFRRAKRNALFWSAATILVAFGAGQKVNLTFLLGLEFETWLALVATLAVLAFFAFGFYRADRRLRLRNSEVSYGKSDEQVADTLSNITDVVNSKYANISQLKDQFQEDFEKRVAAVEAFSRNCKAGLEAIQKDVLRVHEMTKKDVELNRRIERLSSQLSKVEANSRDEADIRHQLGILNQEQTHASQDVAISLQTIGHDCEFLETSVEEARWLQNPSPIDYPDPRSDLDIQSIARSLSDLSDQIDKGEKTTFRWYDQILTSAMMVLAVVVASGRLAICDLWPLIAPVFR